ncbi:MAG: hypothetical protein R3C19_05410 [Planctomycetaceae bacterium]
MVLVRYGSVPQVARFEWSSQELPTTADRNSELNGNDIRGTRVVVETSRGLELGAVLENLVPAMAAGRVVSGSVLRTASDDDLGRFRENERMANQQFEDWRKRIDAWNLQLQLIDLEWTLDRSRIVLYVLNDRGAETTRLALLAAAAGLGIIHVQSVSADGVIQQSSGCGSGGCGSGGCS